MSHISYVSGTVIPSTWLNDVDTVVYTLFGNGISLNSPSKLTIPQVNAPAGSAFSFGADGGAHWQVPTSAHLIPITDNIRDIGTPTNRIRTLNIGTSISFNSAVAFSQGGGGALTISIPTALAASFTPATESTGIGSCSLYSRTGVPNNASGNNGDILFRADGGAGTTIYQKRSGTWVGIV